MNYIIYNNQVYNIGASSHIQYVIDNTHLFNTTRSQLLDIFNQFNEHPSQEGKARDYILSTLCPVTRIRKIKGCYIVQCASLSKSLENILFTLLSDSYFKVIDFKGNLLLDTYNL